MNPMLKPYRLINNTELKTLQDRFNATIQVWNEKHALHPLTCVLSRPSTQDALTQEWVVFSEGDNPRALLLDSDYATIKHSLFDDVSDCFDAICKPLLLTLLSDLLGVLLQSQHTRPNRDEWFYKGTPSQVLTLSTPSHAMTFYLHPQWVIAALPNLPVTPTKLESVKLALSEQKLTLQVELMPVSLRLKDIINLTIGDVIKTDHPITSPINLKHRLQTICDVDIGESNAYKSIQIARQS